MQKSKEITPNKKFKILRVFEGVSQQELAQRVGVSQQTISFIETGGLKPGKRLKESIAKALNVKPEELFKENQ